MQFDPSDPFFSAPAARAAPATRPRRRRARRARAAAKPAELSALSGWARLDPKVQEAARPPFSPPAPASLGSTAILRQNPPFAGALRNRLALKAAAASARLLRLREDEAGLRDAEHLAAAEDPGPGGRLHRLWRCLAGQDARLDAEAVWGGATSARLAGAGRRLPRSSASCESWRAGAGDPVTLAAQAATRAYHSAAVPRARFSRCGRPMSLLALRLGWERPAPLLVTKILDPALALAAPTARDRGPAIPIGRRRSLSAYALAAGDAHALAQSSCRDEPKSLLAVAPKLRAKARVACRRAAAR